MVNPVILTGMVLASMVIGPMPGAETTQDDCLTLRCCLKGVTTSVALVCRTPPTIACGRFPSGYV